MTAVPPIPYSPKKEPKVEFIPFDGLKFKTVFWEHTGTYKGRILFVHGFSEDSLIYTEFFDRLSDLGFDIFFFDQRGAGETSDTKDIGKTNEAHTFNDLDFMIKKNLEITPHKDDKLILMGHSMGGGIILNYGIRGKYKEYVKTIIATAPEVLLHPSTSPNFILKGFGTFASKYLPNVRIDAGLNYDYITSNEKWIKYIKGHNKKFWITGPLFMGMLERGEALTKSHYVAKFDPDISLLVFHSKNDHVNWYEGTKKFYDLLNDNVHKELVSFDDAQHSLCIEVDKYVDQLLEKIVEFTSK
ncbi:hypothetical protein CANTEDRAFT_115469 [Yamadazyma tenuis ATCC 10573]|uniref:Alpha/beta-hydrolase n=1 Tax=Candida tenuis (strain ATCC 10573 / BCRC 21748 / CBS 615 / JCM 9827 / NBRC 10315 / NRRL Y-1498 / VKM Y-70) TaxID=590646 RepID=G3BA42_CANTC|nr:alpha/beta-hydrolase [Yamadazyma tenuis ATCC 10573]XP_006688919.1 uncharacterized protein CANTEDRAFT_115469 [Yamadazyma tenuis ATCC 10573]EGV62748.1 alpha/beta-hydrolase [Yamadazyma tenuis ATCC 10573]EGV62749.1 hypothetical protein CANTEDRAFT_115469 [Yamadazyma tenuis ATCC 10573]